MWYTHRMNARVWRMLCFLSIALNVVLVLALLLERDVRMYDVLDRGVRQEEFLAPESEDAETTTNERAEVGSFDAEPAHVVRVIDGDTLVVQLGTGERTVRLIGIDAPETGPTTAAECMAGESTAQLTTLVGTSQVLLEKDTSQGTEDRYGRLLAYLRTEAGVDVGLALVREGFAREYMYHTPYTRQSEYRAAEDEAIGAERGLWSPSLCPVAKHTEASTPEQLASTVHTGATTPSSTNGSEAYECGKNIYNCSSFTTQSEAQALFDACGGKENDVHKLDSDKDGVVCESLP